MRRRVLSSTRCVPLLKIRLYEAAIENELRRAPCEPPWAERVAALWVRRFVEKMGVRGSVDRVHAASMHRRDATCVASSAAMAASYAGFDSAAMKAAISGATSVRHFVPLKMP